MPDNSEKIQAIDEKLEGGIANISTDGLSIGLQSRADLISERRRLVSEDTSGIYTPRSRVLKIDLGGF